jgi:bifunctional enzyme CysN/CysC
VNNQPTPTREFEAMVCWMSDRELGPRGRYSVKHTTRTGRALVEDLRYQIDVNTLHRDEDATSLGLNEIGRVRLKTSVPFLIDDSRRAGPREASSWSTRARTTPSGPG